MEAWDKNNVRMNVSECINSRVPLKFNTVYFRLPGYLKILFLQHLFYLIYYTFYSSCLIHLWQIYFMVKTFQTPVLLQFMLHGHHRTLLVLNSGTDF